jgi:hypothetical protein
VRDLIAFPDHHAYGPRDLDAVARRARAVGAGLVVTTEKDAVRLGLPSAPGAVRDSVLARQVVEGLPPTWALRVRLEPIASSSMAPREKPSRQGGAIGDWRRELRTRIDAAARQPRDATAR